MNRASRNLIVAFDGTDNEFDDTNTNVVKLCTVLKMDDRDRQMVYYQPGIGTYTDPSITGKLQKWLAKITDMAGAWYIGAHVMRGYEFLMENYLPGDGIVLFGFSRGAYTARALAGMLETVGLLSRGNHEQVPFAYRIYKEQSSLARDFKATFCTPVEIRLVGVWDTVGSMGFLVPKRLPLASRKAIKYFRHAISLDETRARFNVTKWKPDNNMTKADINELRFGRPSPVKEMWFAGGHCDIGGGNDKDTAPKSLSNISLRWMLHEVQELNIGILFDNDGLDRLAIPTDCVERISDSDHHGRSPTDITVVSISDTPEKKKIRDSILSWKEADHRDADIAMNLALKPWSPWWLLQFPVWNGEKDFNFFWGRRSFPVADPNRACAYIHPTVPKHKEGNGTKYRPNAILPSDWRDNAVYRGHPHND